MSYSLVARKASFGLVETLPYVPPQTPGGEMSWPSCAGEFVVMDAAGRPAGCYGDCPDGWERYVVTDPAAGNVHYCVPPGAPVPPSFNPEKPASPPGSGVPAPSPKPSPQPIAEQKPAASPATDTTLMLIVGGGALLLLGVVMMPD